MLRYEWNHTDTPIKVPFTYNSGLNIGDTVYGDMVEYGRESFYQGEISGQSYQIITPIVVSGTSEYIHWKYNPFIPFRLRYFSDNINKANSGDTSYESVSSIPNYATNIFNGNYIWRNILQQGIFDPLTDIGVDYPFVNGRRYLFLNIIFDVTPDLSDAYTLDVFTNLKFGAPIRITNKPIGSILNIGKPCQ